MLRLTSAAETLPVPFAKKNMQVSAQSEKKAKKKVNYDYNVRIKGVEGGALISTMSSPPCSQGCYIKMLPLATNLPPHTYSSNKNSRKRIAHDFTRHIPPVHVKY